MNKFVIPALLSITLIFGISTVYAQSVENTIPVWVKGVINFWTDDQINDDEFIQALEFLIEQNIINIDSTDYDEMEEGAKYWEGMYDDAENRRVAYSQNIGAQHKILYDEKDAKYEALKVTFDERVERLNDGFNVAEERYVERIEEKDAKIEELENQLRER